jgi:LysM repeat protein
MVPYTVQAGDTLFGIAAGLGVPVSERAAWAQQVATLNGLADPDTIVVGQQLQLPGSPPATVTASATPVANTVAYVVKPGDTLYGIGAGLGVPVDALGDWVKSVAALNRLADPDSLTPGEALQLPAPVAAATPSAPPATAAPAPNAGPRPGAPPATISYTLQSGETLTSVARKLGIADDQVQAWAVQVLQLSGIASPQLIQAGQTIQVPLTAPQDVPPQASATPSPQATVPPTTPAVMTDYTVQSGDTLSGIADKLGVSAEQVSSWIAAVVKANSLGSPDLIFAGQRLLVPGSGAAAAGPGAAPAGAGSCYYTVQAGDSWASIAARNGVAGDKLGAWADQVASLNGIDPDVLPVGDALRLPC